MKFNSSNVSIPEVFTLKLTQSPCFVFNFSNKVYESLYIAYLATSGSKREKTK